ncbi:relaxase domain-containing protein [Aeromicrobium sp. CFBP 8757]|uniref:MobF family relaxase n=1 Tax=Aeromicrobium sp. CFBP 8757 TaxID=2775288 RepID=UPI00177C1E37|nr:MobF family relaxase [Aeromicrobium sp. CFBP 8757]MBD8605383.1 relaxase domain-containing protein [Aeromicrobium sp. CFBP 8757]
MSLHKLTAGSGYDYLTRQVAAQDATEKGHTSLASYYTEKGETPGVWVGSGLAGVEGLAAGDVVTAEQMKALFAYGFHPLADARLAELGDTATAVELKQAQRLGTPFKVYDGDVSGYQIDVARRIEELNVEKGLPRDTAVSIEDRARIRTEVARGYFEREYSRECKDARELAATIAKHSRPKTTAVAGFDLTFSPVKSVSTLWAIADAPNAAQIEMAHNAAVRDAVAFLEKQALFTREGTNGARQVDVKGLIATAFTHRDSRAGDPDLHTHVAIANKVQTLDGKWLAIDGRVLCKATVAASETYNTALERHLSAALAMRFAERPGGDPRKRPVREVVGVDPALNERWSSRRASIEVRRAELATDFQCTHGRPPTPVEAMQLAQQATLETREAKHEPRSLAEQRQTWRSEAVATLGSEAAVDQMVQSARARTEPAGQQVTSNWVAACAADVVNEVEQRRSTWQVWHVRAEALRRVRDADVPAERVETVVDHIVDAALARSVSLATDRDGVDDPAALRRIDGSSAYHVAGSDLFTSRSILDAEQRIVAVAATFDGRRITPEIVELSLLESAANGVELNSGQASMVRGMATSGARVQLGIAAAGTGKTTAMSVLTRAWEESGGNIVGLAPSAAAAAALRDQTGATTDTLAKLLHAITTGDMSQVPGRIDRGTLVLIDEAGMADTLALDAAVQFIVGRGGSVRLIGDDQQLAAIGAGGVLRDIDTQHGSLRLSELMRFADPAEGAASLALRSGMPESLGYYLDHDRVHVGDLATLTDTVFTSWQADRAEGRDSIMLAPTRDLVQELNARARAARLLDDPHHGPAVRLADANAASAGDVIITRNNNRRLRVSATDWVKNGDRWHVLSVDDGSLTVRHTESGLRVVLPADYVAEHTELGYASTVHAAQGVSVDSMHGLATGDESRQQFYTMMTRGRYANDVYLVTSSDGDPHNLIRPETIRPSTATDILEGILARDGSPASATTLARDAADPATLLGQAAARYIDALYVGAETVVGADRVAQLERVAEELVPGIADEPAWPVLRAHLILVQAQGRDAVRDLTTAVSERELDGVDDRAAILDWRLDPTGLRGSAPGPLPWMPAVPNALSQDPVWGPYLTQRSALVGDLADRVRIAAAAADSPAWARQGGARPAEDVLVDIAVWRAANAVNASDRRPTGHPQMQKAPAAHQRQLEERVKAGKAPALAEWGPAIDKLHPRRDSFTPLLAERLAALTRSGIDAARMFRLAADEGPLPDDHAAAAMWWRISRHISPSVATEASGQDGHITAAWSDLLIDTLGAEAADQVVTSPWWPTLVASIDHATQRGWALSDLLDMANTADLDDVDLAQAMVWRIGIITDPPPEDDDPYDYELPPEDLEHVWTPPPDAADHRDVELVDELDDQFARAAFNRDLLDPLEPTDQDIARVLEHGHQWDHSPTTGDRILHINDLTTRYFESRYDGSWAQAHLHQRLGQDIAGDPRFRPGYAPAGWTNLVEHLRRHDITDDEMLAAGVAATASTGRLIDRFRDRAMLPVINNGDVLGFVGRRHPDATDDSKAGPKYLNTSDTVVFHKGSQLYGVADQQMAHGSVPVVVEGPVDAIAVTLASAGAFVGAAPLGTSLTHEQAAQLATFGVDPIVATDGDLAGRMAAERDYWLITPHLLEPRFAQFGAGDDPASLLEVAGRAALVVPLQQATPLAEHLVDERINNLGDGDEQVREAALVIAARPSSTWADAIARTSALTGADPLDLQRAVAGAATSFNTDRRRFSNDQLVKTSEVRARIEQASSAMPVDKWAKLARSLDPRLVGQRDWPATAEMLEQVHAAGHDVDELTRQLVAHTPLDEAPAQDLRYRLVGYLPDEAAPAPTAIRPSSTTVAEHERGHHRPTPSNPDVGPRR